MRSELTARAIAIGCAIGAIGFGCGAGAPPRAASTVPIGPGPRTTRLASVAPFQLDASEITVAQYEACVLEQACAPATQPRTSDPARSPSWQCNAGEGREAHPINCVTYVDAEAYCRWAGKRLPTEDEWEWASRNGERGDAFPWGAAPADPTRARFAITPATYDPGTLPVGALVAGDAASGVHDLMGNVAEWTSSAGPEPGTRAVRGGSWQDRELSAASTRDSRRFTPAATTRSPTIGFRCARGG